MAKSQASSEMSLTSFETPEQVAPHTPTPWRPRTVEARLVYLSLLLSHDASGQFGKHRNHGKYGFQRRETIHNALAWLPRFWEEGVTTPRRELVASYRPHGKVTVDDRVDALTHALISMTAGRDVKVSKKSEEIIEPLDDAFDESADESGVDKTGEKIAVLIDESADISNIKDLLDQGKGLFSGIALYVYAGISQAAEELFSSLTANGKDDISITRFIRLGEAIEVVNKLGYDSVFVYGDTSTVGDVLDDLTVPRVALNVSPTQKELTKDASSVLQQVRPQSVIPPPKSPLALLRQYMVGRFDNSAQIAREKTSGGQRTAYAMHINDIIDDRLEGGPQDGVIHILEETYKYAPGERNPQIKPLILRFEEIDGAIALTSMKAPDYIDKTALRNDNPCLWFAKDELKVSPSFPRRQIYKFDEIRREFMLDVEVSISETARFHLCETLAQDRLVVSEKLWVGEKLKAGCYEEPFIYERMSS